MVELIVVMVLVGILAAFAAGRFFDRSGFDAAAFADQTRSLLRYAQKAAIARNAPVHVLIDDHRIALCYDTPRSECPPVSRVSAPIGGIDDKASKTWCRDGRWYCLGIPENVQMSLSSAMSDFSFDALGRPVASNGSFAGLTMTIASPGETRSVAVNQETGYVQ